jgi:hypothetical protein
MSGKSLPFNAFGKEADFEMKDRDSIASRVEI